MDSRAVCLARLTDSRQRVGEKRLFRRRSRECNGCPNKTYYGCGNLRDEVDEILMLIAALLAIMGVIGRQIGQVAAGK